MRSVLLLCLFAAFVGAPLTAQEFSGGFRAGLNFISYDGDAETSADGATTFEEFRRTTGFHVGATFALNFTDLVGIKADLMYNQKGGEKRFAGPSYFYLYTNRDDREGVPNFGTLDAEIDVVNSYIDIPVVGFYRLGIFELEAGASMGFLINSRASGGLRYSDVRLAQGVTLTEDVIFNIDGSYFTDDAGGGGVVNRSETELGNTGIFPPSVISAYYNNGSDEKLYRRLDFAVLAGVSVYLNNGLFLGVRYQHGLSDVTKGENDLRLANEDRVEGREFNTDDRDYSRSIQASIGFRF